MFVNRARDQHPGCPGAADQLVWRHEHRVQVVAAAGALGPEVDVDVGGSSGVVEEAQRAVLVEQPRDRTR